MSDAKNRGFQVGAWQVEPNLDRITLAGKTFSLQSRWMDVLVYLANNAGTAVSLDDIMTHVWRDVEVTHDSVYLTISNLRKLLAEDKSVPTYIETITKRGYRLVAPVKFPLQDDAQENAGRERNKLMFAVSVIAILSLSFLFIQFVNKKVVLPPKPGSIAVLPFVDLAPIDNDNFALGFADDLIVVLDTIDGIEIMARTSSFSLDARKATAQEIGRELGVQTVLEGSVRRDGDKIRVTAQLVKTFDGFHIWADTYHFDIAAVSRIHTDVARQVAEGLGLFMPPAYLSTLDPLDVPIVLRTRVNTYTENSQEWPEVLVLKDGGHVIAWRSMDQDGSHWGLYAQKFSADGARDGEELRLHATTLELQFHLDVAAHPDGGFVGVWSSWESDGSSLGVVGRRFNDAAEPIGDEFDVNVFAAREQSLPVVAVTTDGRIFVIFKSTMSDDTAKSIFGRWFDATGQPLGDEFQINTFDPSDQNIPRMASLTTGKLIAVWQSYGQDESGWGAFGQLLDSAGAPLGPEFRVNTFTRGDQDSPFVASLLDGGFIVAWKSRDQANNSLGGSDIFGQRFDSTGTRLGDEFQVNSFTENEQLSPYVTGTHDGGFFVTWTSDNQAGLGMDIFGQRFDSLGEPVGAEMLVNVVTNSYQRHSNSAVLNDGSVIVAFYADDWDGSYFGIFKRRLVFSKLSVASMSGNIGADTFVFEGPFTKYEIVDFDAEIDRIDLSAMSKDFGQLDVKIESGSTTIDTGHGVIWLDGIQQLEAGHFLF